MTVPKTTDQHAAGSVESFLSILRSRGDVELYFEGRALAVIQAVAEDLYLKPAEKVVRVRNVLAAVQRIREDLAGRTYSREDDDPQVIRPHSPRLPLHTGAVVDGGELVDETPSGPPVHLEIAGAQTMCGLRVLALPVYEAWTNDPGSVTCNDCKATR